MIFSLFSINRVDNSLCCNKRAPFRYNQKVQIHPLAVLVKKIRTTNVEISFFYDALMEFFEIKP